MIPFNVRNIARFRVYCKTEIEELDILKDFYENGIGKIDNDPYTSVDFEYKCINISSDEFNLDVISEVSSKYNAMFYGVEVFLGEGGEYYAAQIVSCNGLSKYVSTFMKVKDNEFIWNDNNTMHLLDIVEEGGKKQESDTRKEEDQA